MNMDACENRCREMRSVAVNYDRLAPWYDLLAGPSEGRFRDRGLRMLDALPGDTLLEIGPGTGHALIALASTAGPEGAAWGIDLSYRMCRRAKSRLGPARAMGHGMVANGSGLHLPFPAAAFDAAFMCFTLELFGPPDAAAVLAECRRALRPSGRIGIVAMSVPKRASTMTRLYAWASRRWPSIVDCRPIDAAELLHQHGFDVIDSFAGSLWGLPIDGVVGRVRLL